jgi:hypothetical protein
MDRQRNERDRGTKRPREAEQQHRRAANASPQLDREAVRGYSLQALDEGSYSLSFGSVAHCFCEYSGRLVDTIGI